jgi:hypothetical protein
MYVIKIHLITNNIHNDIFKELGTIFFSLHHYTPFHSIVVLCFPACDGTLYQSYTITCYKHTNIPVFNFPLLHKMVNYIRISMRYHVTCHIETDKLHNKNIHLFLNQALVLLSCYVSAIKYCACINISYKWIY